MKSIRSSRREKLKMNSTRWLVFLLTTMTCRPWESACGQGYPPEEAVRRMTVAEGFAVDLVAAEPLVRQPVAIDFDDRGRLWVLQYLQYPNPAGLKRVKVDRFSRTTYDRVPEPPPHGPKGADRLTILEDTDGDGRIDKAKDFLSDLNIATGFQFGFGGVFVLQTPYLLFYPDRDGDDVPDGDPEVLLKGFGMEDTSSLANSLLWGPDGWLYGTQGTNITASIRGVEFEQGVWRYHPVTKQFELFAEGASNMWGLDFDRHGNLLAGTNYGGYLMFHVVQGAYFRKSFAKHGELHNPFAFGFLEHVPHKNFQGGHVTVGGFVYQGDDFPPRFRDKYIAVDTLGHAVRWHTTKPHGSTLRSENGGVLVQANDTWFAPSDAAMGPDGAVYIADWYDQRTAHPDPDATWDRSNGRIYRLRWNAHESRQGDQKTFVNPQSLSTAQLMEWLKSPNEWRVRRARRVLAERGDATVAHVEEQLRASRDGGDDQQTLQMLWTLHSVRGLDSQWQADLLRHPNATVRAWAIRLLADDRDNLGYNADANRRLALHQALKGLAKSDDSPIVLRQLASTAKRLSAEQAIAIVGAIMARPELQSDPYIPLLTWWAVEQHAVISVDDVLATLAHEKVWDMPFARDVILGRLMRRYAGDGSDTGFAACAQLLTSAPDDIQRRRMLSELDAGLKMLGSKKLPRLPLPDSNLAIRPLEPQPDAKRLKAIPTELEAPLADHWSDETADPLTVRVFARLGSKIAIDRAVALAIDRMQSEQTRLAMLAILQELGDANTCLAPALRIVRDTEPVRIRLAALKLLERFSDDRIVRQLLLIYPTVDDAMRAPVRDVLLSRASSAIAFLKTIDRGEFPPDEVGAEQLRRVALHEHPTIDAIVRKHWGNIRAGTPEEKLAEIRRFKNDLRAADGNLRRGKLIFERQCATCHKLFGFGKDIGPDLTKANRADRDFLLVSMVDPNAQIRKEYLSYVVVTVDGRVVTGLLAENSRGSVTLQGAKGERTTIPRENIEELKVSPVSLMPEDQLKQLQPQQVRDLFQYLQSSTE